MLAAGRRKRASTCSCGNPSASLPRAAVRQPGGILRHGRGTSERYVARGRGQDGIVYIVPIAGGVVGTPETWVAKEPDEPELPSQSSPREVPVGRRLARRRCVRRRRRPVRVPPHARVDGRPARRAGCAVRRLRRDRERRREMGRDRRRRLLRDGGRQRPRLPEIAATINDGTPLQAVAVRARR